MTGLWEHAGYDRWNPALLMPHAPERFTVHCWETTGASFFPRASVALWCPVLRVPNVEELSTLRKPERGPLTRAQPTVLGTRARATRASTHLGATTFAAAQHPSRSADRGPPLCSRTGAARPARASVNMRPHLARIARLGPTGRSANCSRHMCNPTAPVKAQRGLSCCRFRDPSSNLREGGCILQVRRGPKGRREPH